MANETGAFVVWSPSSTNQLALTVNIGRDTITSAIIQDASGTFSLEHSSTKYPSLEALIRHHTMHTRTDLPVKLVPRPRPLSPSSRAMLFVDEDAREAPWFKAFVSPNEVGEEDLQGLGSFVVRKCTHEELQNDAALIVVYVDPLDQLRHEPIRISAEGLRLGPSKFTFKTLSEMVYTYSNDNGERPFLLSLVRGPNDHESQPW